MRRSKLSAIAVALIIVLSLAACVSPAPVGAAPQPLTLIQAQLLAVVRFNNFDQKIRAVQITVLGTAPATLTGWVDFSTSQGYGLLKEKGATATGDSALITWTGNQIRAKGTLDVAVAPLPMPTSWDYTGSLDRAASSLTNVLVLLLALGSDRPENPELLKQSDARYLRADKVGKSAVSVFSGPSSDSTTRVVSAEDIIRYWVDSSGTLLRLQVRASASSTIWSTVDFSKAAGVASLTAP